MEYIEALEIRRQLMAEKPVVYTVDLIYTLYGATLVHLELNNKSLAMSEALEAEKLLEPLYEDSQSEYQDLHDKIKKLIEKLKYA